MNSNFFISVSFSYSTKIPNNRYIYRLLHRDETDTSPPPLFSRQAGEPHWKAKEKHLRSGGRAGTGFAKASAVLQLQKGKKVCCRKDRKKQLQPVRVAAVPHSGMTATDNESGLEETRVLSNLQQTSFDKLIAQRN